MAHRVAQSDALLWIGCLLFVSVLPGRCALGQDLQISRIADLMATPRDEAAKRKPVRVRGTISLLGDGISNSNSPPNAAQSFCLEDPSATIWVRSGHAIREGLIERSDPALSKLDYGTDIELDGYLDQGAFAPVILPHRISIVGHGKLPDAPRAATTRFLNAADELRRVTVNGVVQSIATESSRWWSLRVETGVGHFVTRLPKEPQFAPSRLLDAEVDLTGLAAVCWNWRAEFHCPRLIIANREDIHILKPARFPFDADLVSIENLDGYTPSGRPRHRRRMEGTVTYYDGNLLLYIQDNGTGIQVLLNDPATLQIGDRVEVSGFIDTSRYLAGLRGAVVRRIGGHDSPSPVAMTVAQIIESHQGFKAGQPTTLTSCDGQLIELSGRLLDFSVGTPPQPHRMEIDCGDAVVTAFLSTGARKLSQGTEVRVTGIAKLTFSPPGADARLAKLDRVDLLLRDGNDIVVVSRPSWWTPQRTFNALLVLAGLAVVSCLWAFTLRHTLAQRTNQLASEMRSRRDAALEFQGAIRERTRLAANLHDTLLQTMAGVAYQIEACGLRDQPDRSPLQSHLDTASRMIKHGQEDLRNTVWALHCLPLTEESFVDSVKQVTKKFALGEETSIRIECADNFPPLADFIAGNLLLVIQEAILNATKYAHPKRIDITLGVSPDESRISALIRDDGDGFDVKARKTSNDGHFGLEGMQQRVERLGGTLEIESELGVGTTILAEIPVREFDPEIESAALPSSVNHR